MRLPKTAIASAVGHPASIVCTVAFTMMRSAGIRALAAQAESLDISGNTRARVRKIKVKMGKRGLVFIDDANPSEVEYSARNVRLNTELY
jgi:hypothetical protein